MRFWNHLCTPHFACVISLKNKLLMTLGLEESMLIRGSLINIYLQTAEHTGGKHEDSGMGKLGFEICVCFLLYVCYFGSSDLSSLILNLPHENGHNNVSSHSRYFSECK